MRLGTADDTELRWINLHAHSTASDGELDIEAIAALAERENLYVAVTDHNTTDAHRVFRHERILPGIEVTAEDAAVDVVFVGDDAESVVAFDVECVREYRDPASQFLPIRREMADVLADANRFGLRAIIPHYAHHDGISLLEEEKQEEILRHQVLIELNGQLSERRNDAARSLAERTGHPLVATDDSHCREQYARTLTGIALDPRYPVNASAIWKALRESRHSPVFKIRPPKPREILRTVRQVARSIGLVTLGKMALKKLRHFRRKKAKQP